MGNIHFRTQLLLIVFILLISITVKSQSPSVLNAGSYFSAGQKLISPDSVYTCIFQGDGNLVVYKNMQTAIWSTKTAGKSITKCVLQFDGNLVLYSAGDIVEYNSGSAGGCFPPYWIQMQGDGNLVIYNGKSVAVWSSINGLTNAEKKMDCPIQATSIGTVLQQGGKMIPGQMLVSPNGIYSCVLQGDGNLVVYEYGQKAIWNTQTVGAGVTHCVIQNDGNFVLYSNTTAKWDSKTFKGKYPPYWIQMQGDGNLVIYNSRKQATWSSMFGATNVENPPVPPKPPKKPTIGCDRDLNIHYFNSCDTYLLVYFIEIVPGTSFACQDLNYIGTVYMGGSITATIHKGKIGYFAFATDSEGKCLNNYRKGESWVNCLPGNVADVYFNICQ